MRTIPVATSIVMDVVSFRWSLTERKSPIIAFGDLIRRAPEMRAIALVAQNPSHVRRSTLRLTPFCREATLNGSKVPWTTPGPGSSIEPELVLVRRIETIGEAKAGAPIL